METKTRSIAIQEQYVIEIERIVEQSTRFATCEEFINYILQEFLFGEQTRKESQNDSEINQRLRDLGYL